jgi:hypothetical protein
MTLRSLTSSGLVLESATISHLRCVRVDRTCFAKVSLKLGTRLRVLVELRCVHMVLKWALQGLSRGILMIEIVILRNSANLF